MRKESISGYVPQMGISNIKGLEMMIQVIDCIAHIVFGVVKALISHR